MLKKIEESCQFIKSKMKTNPKIAIILGSGLGEFTQTLLNQVCIPYSTIPHFKPTTVKGHDGKLVLGNVNGVDVLVMSGRYHFYEGHSCHEVIHPTRVLAKLGIKILILTNAAGSVNLTYKPGDLCLIKDHLNLMGTSPLIGENIDELGPRFPDMSEAYNKELNNIIKNTAEKNNILLHEGVYAGLTGPCYETPSEIKMVRILGGDLVGMSTVFETIAANHMGLSVCAISCITNFGAGIIDQKLSHDHIKDEAARAYGNFSTLLTQSLIKFKELV